MHPPCTSMLVQRSGFRVNGIRAVLEGGGGGQGSEFTGKRGSRLHDLCV